MVCKDDIFMWFKSLKGSKRIEVMCGLLNMCCSLELRFCGTCLEDIGRRDFYSLREDEVKANNVTDILKIKNINEAFTRSQLIVILSLLNSSNIICSNALFKILTDEIKIETMASSGLLTDSKVVDQILLLLTMAQNHPAFTFDQQTLLCELCEAVDNYAQQILPRANDEDDENSSLGLLPTLDLISSVVISDADTCSSAPMCQHHLPSAPRTTDPSSHNQAQITSLKAKVPHKKMYFRIRVAWGTSKVIDVYKTPHDIAVFHQKLVQLYPFEAQATHQEKYIPHLPHTIAMCAKQEMLNDNLTSNITEYIRQLHSHLPSHIMQSDHVVNFFLPSGHNRCSLSRGSRCPEHFPIDDSSKNPRLRSLTIYNSHISGCTSGSWQNGRSRVASQNSPSQLVSKKVIEDGSSILCGQSIASPLHSPLNSPLSSPYTSPTNSEANSRSASPWTSNDRSSATVLLDGSTFEKMLMKEQLYEYWDVLRHYRLDELQAMPVEEFECLGILKEACAKLKKILDNFRNSVTVNQGLVKGGQLAHHSSNDSSPVCSEFSSPPPSPPPSDVCNRHSPIGFSTEDVDKGTKTRVDVSKIGEITEPSLQEPISKRMDEALIFTKSNREFGGRHSVVSLPVGYAIPQLQPSQAHKPSFLSMQCRANAGLHLSPGSVVFDNQFSRGPLPSALSFIPHMTTSTQRSHSGTPERALSSSSTGLPITTVCPFPINTSGCSTVPSATCSVAANKSCNFTAVTNSVASGNGIGNRMLQKVQSQAPRDGEVVPKLSLHPHSVETLYTSNCGYLLTSSDASVRPNPVSTCSCLCAVNAPRQSHTPSPSLSPGATPQQPAVPVSLPYIGLPYVFHHSIPFIQAHSGAPANGFMQPPSMTATGHGYTYALPNGMSAIPPELLYGAQAFSLQSPSPSQATAPVAPSVSQCYGSYPQAANVSGLAVTHTVKVVTCYNCGKLGHRGPDCKEQSIDEMSNPGKLQLNYALPSKPPENND